MQWYDERDPARRAELVTALHANVANPHIEAVVLFHAWADRQDSVAAVLAAAQTDVHVADPARLRAIYQGTRSRA